MLEITMVLLRHAGGRSLFSSKPSFCPASGRRERKVKATLPIGLEVEAATRLLKLAGKGEFAFTFRGSGDDFKADEVGELSDLHRTVRVAVILSIL
jgi:hypothetical protein